VNRLAALLAGRPAPVLLDGGMGTMLQDAGLEGGEAGELWNAERPEAVEAIHEGYAATGVQILTTNTFGGTRPRLAMHGLEDRVVELSRAGAEVARRVAERHGALVAGGLGPTGELLEPLGTLTADDARAVFAEQLEGLLAGSVDLILIETMSDLGEVEAAVLASTDVAPDLPVIATCSFDTNGRTMMGVAPAMAVRALAALGVDAVGANCGRGPGEMEDVARQLVDARPDGLMLVAQPNAGLPRLVGDHFEYDGTPDVMAEHAARLRDLGIDLIGACCGSTPEHLAAMRGALV
jgi:5-methyltetrahydrofolate--homocysteine methyltransferase